MVRQILTVRSMIKSLIGVLCAIAGFGGASARGVTLDWARQLGGAAYDSAYDISLDGLGSIYLAGRTSNDLGGPHAGNTDAYLSKFDALGTHVWTRQLGSTEIDIGYGVSADELGNVFIGGTTWGSLGGPLRGSPDAFVSKYDALGNQLWVRQLGDDITDGRAVSADGHGNVYVSGWIRGDVAGLPNNSNFEAFLAKYEGTGNRLWYRQVAASADVYGLSMAADRLGSVYLSGYTFGNLEGRNAGSRDAFLVKYSDSGDRLWTRQIGTPESDRGEAVAADGLGNVFLAGATEGSLAGPNAGRPDAFVSKYDASGNLQWVRQFGTANFEEEISVAADGLGNAIVSGVTWGSLNGASAGGIDAFASKFDAAGNLLWSEQLGTASSDYGTGVVADGSDHIYVAGYTGGNLAGPTFGNFDAFIARFSDPVPELRTLALAPLAAVLVSFFGRGKNRSRRWRRRPHPRPRPLRAESLESRQMLDAGWVAALGGANGDRLWDLAGDAAGNTYIVGEFSGTGNFGGKILTSAGGGDVFVAKLNATGQVQWATRAGGASGSDLAYSVAVDAKGNVFVTGHFTGSAKFGNTTLVSAGATDAFVAKLAGNNGAFQWARKLGGSGLDRGLAIEIDAAGNALVSGGLHGATFVYAEGNNSQYGASQLFVTKYKTNGTQLWNRTVTGAFTQASLEGLAVDPAGGIYVAGSFAGTMNLPTGALTSTSAVRDFVIAKLSSSGVWQWAESASPTVDGDIRGAAYRNGKLYVTGAFEGTASFDAHTLTSAGITDGFVAGFDVATRAFDWAQRFGGADMDIGREVALDAQGNVHVVGSYRGTADFGWQTLVNTAPAGTSFVTLLSPAGVFLDSMTLGGPGSNSARNIAFDSAGNHYIGGHFEGQAQFPQATITAAGGIDSYVVKLPPPTDSNNGGALAPLNMGLSSLQSVTTSSAALPVTAPEGSSATLFGEKSLASKRAAELARNQVFASFASERNYAPAKRASATATASMGDGARFADRAAHDNAALDVAFDAAFASVL